MTWIASGTASPRRQVLHISLLIAAYLLFNLALTFYSKLLLSTFPRPYLLTALHTGVSAIGCRLSTCRRKRPQQSTNLQENDANNEQSRSSESDVSALERGDSSRQSSFDTGETEKLLPGTEDGGSAVGRGRRDNQTRLGAIGSYCKDSHSSMRQISQPATPAWASFRYQ